MDVRPLRRRSGLRLPHLAVGVALIAASCGLSGVGADQDAWLASQADAATTLPDVTSTEDGAADIVSSGDAPSGEVNPDGAVAQDAAVTDSAANEDGAADAATGDGGGVDADEDSATLDASGDGDGGEIADVPPPECVTSTECKGEGTYCSAWQCQKGSCVLANLADGTTCPNADKCQTSACLSGACVLSKSKVCDDGNPCTKGTCLADKGSCVHLPAAGSCTDDDLCTDDACKEGACAGALIDCSDGDPCTDDGCAPASGCVYTKNTAPCSDGSPCSVLDTCAAGKCGGKPALLTTTWKPGGLAAWSDALATADGGAFVVGASAQQQDGATSWWTQQIDAAGSVVSTSKAIAAVATGLPSVVTVTGGDRLLVGTSKAANNDSSHCRGARVTEVGKVVWLKTWKGALASECDDAVTRGDGQHLLVGRMASKQPLATSPYLLLVDDAGKQTTQSTLGGHSTGEFRAASADMGNGTVVCGKRTAVHPGGRTWVVGIDAKLAPRWQRRPWPTSTSGCEALARGKNGHLFGAGWATEGGLNRRLVFALNANGALLWARTTHEALLNGAMATGVDGGWLTGGSSVPSNGVTEGRLQWLSMDGRSVLTRTDKIGEGLTVWRAARRLSDGRMLLVGAMAPKTFSTASGVLRWVDNWGHANCVEAGKCAPQLGNGCNDGNPCTDNLCDAAKGCANPTHVDACDDGKACTSGARCMSGSCKAGSPRLWRHVYDNDDSQLLHGLPLNQAMAVPAVTALPGGGWATVSRVQVAGKGLEARVDRFAEDASQPQAQAIHGGPGDQVPMAICGGPDGGLVIAGGTTSGKGWVKFLDNKLGGVAQHHISAGAEALLVDLQPSAGGAVCALGRSWASPSQKGPAKLLLAQVSEAGVQNMTTFGAPGWSLSGTKMVALTDDEVAIAGERQSDGGSSEVLLARVHRKSGIVWQRGLAPSPGAYATRTLVRLDDGGYLVGTTVNAKTGLMLPSVIRTAAGGAVVWQWQFAGAKGWVHGRISAMVAHADGSAGVMAIVGEADGPANVPSWTIVSPGGSAKFQELSLFGVNVPGSATLTDYGDAVIAMQTEPKGPGKHFLSLMRLNGWGQHDCKAAGVCGELTTADCGPGLPCVQGACDPTKGCAVAPIAFCDDGKHCSLADVCVAGVCQGGTETKCDDDNACTKDACTDAQGCTHKLDPGAPCEEGQFCITKDACTKDGACVGKPMDCADGHACTDDSCNEMQKGCLHKPQQAKCDDASTCTTDACTPAKGCVHTPVKLGTSCGGDKVCSGSTCTVPWAVAVAVGDRFSCALHPGGGVSCWGDDKLGQLGSGKSGPPSAKPVPTPTVKGAGLLTAGQSNVCVSESGAGPVCWGANQAGQSLPGDKQALVKPTMFYGKKIAALALSDEHGCAIYSDGTAGCWGHDRGGTFANPATSGKTFMESPFADKLAPFLGVSTAYGTTCMRMASGAVWCAGDSAQVGTPKAPKNHTADVMAVMAADGKPLTGITQLRGCTLRTLALDGAGQVFAWGKASGFLAPWKDNRANPIKLPGKAKGLAGGLMHACFLLLDGSVWCQGLQTGTWLGVPNVKVVATPMKIPGLSNVLSIAAHDNHNCALRADGAVLCWGQNAHGQCGTGALSPYSKPSVVMGSAPGP